MIKIFARQLVFEQCSIAHSFTLSVMLGQYCRDKAKLMSYFAFCFVYQSIVGAKQFGYPNSLVGGVPGGVVY